MLTCNVTRWVQCSGSINCQKASLPRPSPNAKWETTSISSFGVQKEQYVCQCFPLLRDTAAAVFILMQLFSVTVALYCNCCCCSVPMQHCCVIVALSSNCHHCFVLIQHCCVTFALSNNRCHHHFVLMQLCCVTVTLIGDISILIS